jgi:hypothetical protein
VEVIRTVVAVTDPVVPAGPKALTQSPTATALAATVWVAPTVVLLVVVILRVSVLSFGAVGFFVFELDLLGLLRLPVFSETPETVRVDPLTLVTLPDEMLREANCLRKLLDPEPPGKLGRVPPALPPPPRKNPPPPAPAPPAGKPPEAAPPVEDRAPTPPHWPLEFGVLTVIERAAMVVLDFFDAVPVTVMQSPVASALTASVTDLENCVVVVQSTVV